MSSLLTLNVMPLLSGYEKELAADAEMLIQKNICTHVACIMSLCPEGNPPEDKAAVLAERYRNFVAAFHGDRSKIGVLIQSSIGHGWLPGEPCNFERIHTSAGVTPYQMCPLGKDFLKYLDNQISTIARLKPAFFMVDDDFRLITGRNGCWCPLHLAEMAKRTNRTWTAETLYQAMDSDPDLLRIFDQVQKDSLLAAADVIRSAFERYAPGIPGQLSACSIDIHHADEIVERLSNGKDTNVVRINNARYLCDNMRTFPGRMYQGAFQIAMLAPGTTVLAETDTCPQTRWSTSASLLHSHYTGSILEGCNGAKHWLTRCNIWEPREGTAYRKILAKYNGFYETLYQSLKQAKPAPFATAVLPEKRCVTDYRTRNVFSESPHWVKNLGVLGIPDMFVKNPDMPVMLTAGDIKILSDAELENAARHGLVLNGEAAAALTERGLSGMSGITAELWNGARIYGEITDDGKNIRNAETYYTLKPLYPAEFHGTIYHSKSGAGEKQTIGPAVCYTVNQFGARVAAFSANHGKGIGFESFSFLNLQRKEQIIQALEYVCDGKISYVPGDNEIYMKQFALPDNSQIFAFFNLSFDAMDDIPFVPSGTPIAAEYLTPDGKWETIRYQNNSLDLPLMPAQPQIIKIRY